MMIANMDITSFAARIIDNSLTLAAMVVAIWWLQKFVTKLDSERNARLDGMSLEIDRLRARSDKCEEDRLLLHRELRVLNKLVCPIGEASGCKNHDSI